MSNTQRIVIIGATSGIAQACARLWAQEGGAALVLVGRDPSRLEHLAADLRVRGASSIDVRALDFTSVAQIRTLADEVAGGGAVSVVLVAHGQLSDQARCQDDLDACRAALEINAVSPALFAEAFAGHLARQGEGTLALIGSVAGDRGRQSNYIYGAAKGLVDRYAQGLRHRLAGTRVRVVLIKPGPTDTPMTAQLKAQGARLAPVEDVAAGIVQAVRRGRSVVYLPGRWRLIMWVIRHLPEAVFHRMKI